MHQERGLANWRYVFAVSNMLIRFCPPRSHAAIFGTYTTVSQFDSKCVPEIVLVSPEGKAREPSGGLTDRIQ